MDIEALSARHTSVLGLSVVVCVGRIREPGTGCNVAKARSLITDASYDAKTRNTLRQALEEFGRPLERAIPQSMQSASGCNLPKSFLHLHPLGIEIFPYLRDWQGKR